MVLTEDVDGLFPICKLRFNHAARFFAQGVPADGGGISGVFREKLFLARRLTGS